MSTVLGIGISGKMPDGRIYWVAHGRQYAREYKVPADPRTNKQIEWRTRLGGAAQCAASIKWDGVFADALSNQTRGAVEIENYRKEARARLHAGNYVCAATLVLMDWRRHALHNTDIFYPPRLVEGRLIAGREGWYEVPALKYPVSGLPEYDPLITDPPPNVTYWYSAATQRQTVELVYLFGTGWVTPMMPLPWPEPELIAVAYYKGFAIGIWRP